MIKHICDRCAREQVWTRDADHLAGEPTIQPSLPVPSPQTLCFKCIEDVAALASHAHATAEQIVADWAGERGAAVTTIEDEMSRIDTTKRVLDVI